MTLFEKLILTYLVISIIGAVIIIMTGNVPVCGC